MRSLLSLVLLVAIALIPNAAVAASDGVVTEKVAFRVRNPADPLFSRTVRGTLYLPASAPRCGSSVVLLLHGLSYGAWVWDFPLQPETYSVARALAANGFPAVAIDELGYGASDHPNGYTLTVESYGELTSQIAGQLRSGRYSANAPIAFERVTLFGHSAGTEMAELAAGLRGGVDGLIATAYSHFPSTGILLDVITQDSTRALLRDYVYFTGTPQHRAESMYNLSVADPAVVELDNELANLTPSGEILSIGNQPSRTVLPLITVPVLLVMAEQDALFPPTLAGVSLADAELALFLGSADRTLHVVPGAGHSYMLHPNAPQTQQVITDWLRARFPACPAG